jgi:CheY-like chemotaxis protein
VSCASGREAAAFRDLRASRIRASRIRDYATKRVWLAVWRLGSRPARIPTVKTVVIVDDHATFRASARQLLESQGYEVLGEAANGLEALQLVAELRPQLVLLDVQLPDIDGFEVTERLCALADPPNVVLTSSRDDYASAVAGTGARGFIPKDALSAAGLEALIA